MPLPLSTILIAGTSHVGKSTLAGQLSERLGWEAISTDSLARHPGRPWPGIPSAVDEFYRQLSADSIHWFLKVHHQNIWPMIRTLIDSRLDAGTPTILEGAALRPEFIAPLLGGPVTGVFLHAGTEFLLQRMRAEARYDEAAPRDRQIMKAFMERSLRENTEMLSSALDHHVPVFDVSKPQAIETLVAHLAALVFPG